MRSLALAALLGFVAAQSSVAECQSTESCSASLSSFTSLSSSSSTPSATTSSTSSATSPVASSTTSSRAASTTSTGPRSAITVATDGSGQYTAINAAVKAAQDSGIPTVSVLPGTYSEAVNVLGQATVTIVGPSPTGVSDWSKNEVTIAATTIPFSIGTDRLKGITVRNIDIINSAAFVAGGTATALSLRGSNVAFYGCSIISPGNFAVSATYGLAFFANSYIEGYDKIFFNYPSAYVYKSTIVPLNQGALIVYNKGGTPSGSSFTNSTVVVDSSSIEQKTGYTTKTVYLAASNGLGAATVYRDTKMGSLISPLGYYGSAKDTSFFGEYQNSGPGSYDKNAATRGSNDIPLSAEQVSQFTIDKVFGRAFFPYGSSSLDWIDRDVLSSIQASNSVQLPSTSSSSSATSIGSSTTLSAASSSVSSTASTIASSSAFSSPSSTDLVSSSSASGSLTASSVTASSTPSATCSMTTASPTLVVSKTPGPCEYANITAAISAIPDDKLAYIIEIGAGTYVEQISITRKGKVTLIGATDFTNDYSQNRVRIEFARGELTSAGKNEQTPVIYSKKTSDNSGLAMYNIDFVNTYPQTKNTAALAADFYGANMAAYGCSFIGFQDTLLANKGTQVFSNCYIEGSVDFIWGFSTAYFYQCKIVSNTPGAFIAAHSRPSATDVGGYVFDSCMVTYSSTYGNSFGLSYLGRPYNQFSVAVYMNSYIDKHIKDIGWSVWSPTDPQTSGVTFGEYNNSGPGSWQANTLRAAFATNFTASQAARFQLSAWIGDTTWLDMNAYNAIPSYSLTGPSTTPSSPSSSASSSPSSSGLVLPSSSSTASGPTSTATVNAHPESGSVPPEGAVVVSTDSSQKAAFTSIAAALASLPQDSTNQTVFIYPGTYNEQIPSVNRPGAVRIIGYTTSSPGQSYKGNQVTISFARGLSVSPLPAGHSNAETAVFATGSSRISMYNINMINTDNLDGATPSYVTLAGSIYGNDIGFYGCSFDGWQDTLLTGATAGYQYYESCYIGGAIDFIWGYSKAYFKGCTIAAKRKSSAITAHSRKSSAELGGYIFDNCLFTAAPGAAEDLTNKVYLGRPYSQYALVVIKNSYIDSTIIPVGWKIWSATDPRIDHITFAEYNNVGPSNWENNAAARESFGYATLLTSDNYPLSAVMDWTEWIDMTYWSTIVTPQPSVPVVTPPGPVVVGGNSTFDGMTPPSDALIVSKTPIDGVVTYDTIQGALDAAPTTKSVNATIFIYPGVYEEQLILAKSGHTILRGYSDATDDYSKNQVTIQFSRGIDTQGTGGSNTDGATVYAKGNYFHAFNINFRNNFGTQQNMASLGFAVQSSKFAALYGCQIYGNQDTLSVSGNLFTFRTYIEGNVDFIYGSGSAYFLDSTISPNEDSISITAHKRTTNTTPAGFVFDQCTLKPAPGSGTFSSVSLGRPWNNFSRVAYVDCYFDFMISPAGWSQWSKSSPQTDGVTYGEYHNSGPGSSTCNRASFSQQLSDTDVVQFQLGSLFTSTAFIDFRYVDIQPFAAGVGSPQACSTASSNVLSSSTMSSSISMSSSSSLPVVTAYTTTTLVAKFTASTTIAASEATLTTLLRSTETVSITPSEVLKIITLKVTATTSIISPDATSTATSVITEDVGLTITPEPITKSSVVKETITVSEVMTKAAETSTIKGTTTIVVLYTSSPKPTSITVSEGSTVFQTSSKTQKAASTTIKTTLSIAPSTTKTSTVQAKSSITVSSTSIKTTTKKSTTTLLCIPTGNAEKLVRRGAVIPRALASTTTLTVIETVSSFVATRTTTQPGSTMLVTESSIATKTTFLKASTSTTTVTSVVKTSTIAQAGSTYYTTILSTSKTGKTTTLKPATSTVFSTELATKAILSTITAPVVTISSLKTTSKTSTITAAQETTYITKSNDVTSKTTITLPVSTSTKYETVTLGSGVETKIVTAQPKTVTRTSKSTVTTVSWATKTSKGAAMCTS